MIKPELEVVRLSEGVYTTDSCPDCGGDCGSVCGAGDCHAECTSRCMSTGDCLRD